MQLASRVALAATGALLPLLILEVALRVFGPFLPGTYDTGAYLVRHPIYGHYHPPHLSAWTRRDEFVVHIQTNGEGQRGPSVPTTKAPGVFRILVLGDSFVEAIQVAEHERFLARLDGALNPPGEPRRFELIDGGCSGWGTAQEYLYLRHAGPRYQPDLVLLAFFVGNDVQNNSLDLELEGRADLALKPYYRLGSGGRLELLEPRPPAPTLAERTAWLLRDRSAVYNMVESGVMWKLALNDLWAAWREVDALRDLADRSGEVFETRLSDRWRNAWAITHGLIEMTRAEATGQGSRFAMMIVPTRAQVSRQVARELGGEEGRRDPNRDLLQPNRFLAEISARSSTPLLDLLPVFLRARLVAGSEPLYFEYDRHWTAAGHAVAAQAIAEFLRSERLIPE